MAFSNAHDFYIHQLNAVDGQSKEFKRLLDSACPGAAHRSAERGDAPKCHPDTRKAVLKDIMSWVDSTDSKEPLMWLSGPAGAGKSSIAQTVCENCDEDQKLLASFFFSRSAVGTGRNDGNKLIPTIALQLAVVIPETKSYIIGKLEKDPMLLQYSMEKQLNQLVLEPLVATIATLPNKDKIPYLIVIDGLDECFDRSMQAKIITVFSAIGSNANTRFRCLIASRPELEIRNTFNMITTPDTCASIVLDDHYKPDNDIRIYLRSELSSLKRKHTLMSHLSQDSNWPTSGEIDWLVNKSSGQFIYASTVIKFLEDPRGNPRASLRAIIDRKISKREKEEKSPYPALDALYRFILESAALNVRKEYRSLIITVFRVLLYSVQQPSAGSWGARRMAYAARGSDARNIKWTLSGLSFFLSMSIIDLELLLSDLHSILSIPKNGGRIEFYHASLGDFFKDPSRSGQFYIDEKGAHKVISELCFLKLSDSRYRSINPDDYSDEKTRVVQHCRMWYLSYIQKCGYSPPMAYFVNIRAKLMKLEIEPSRSLD